MKRRNLLLRLLPFCVGCLLGYFLYKRIGWWGFLIIFPWIGFMISVAGFIDYFTKKRELGRRIAILAISPVFLILIGIINRENLQLEETVFFIWAGVFSRVLIHYAIAKVLGPLLFRRAFCSWACWTAAILEWLPIKENRKIPQKYTYIRFLVLIISIVIPIAFIYTGYNYKYLHLNKASGQMSALYWFLIGNGFYYAFAIALAFIFKKKRAFCKIACPVSLIMKVPSLIGKIRRKPTGNDCIDCGKCNKVCPMDVDVVSYIKNGKHVNSTECILCSACIEACPVSAIK